MADGGYFENSGAEIALSIFDDIKLSATTYINHKFADKEKVLAEDCKLNIVVSNHKDVEWKGCDANVFLIQLAITTTAEIDANSTNEPPGDTQQSLFFDPIITFLSARTARGMLALSNAADLMCGTKGPGCPRRPNASLGFFRNYISSDELGLPLGWYLSSEKAVRIVEEAIPPQVFDYRQPDFELEHDMLFLIMHLDLELYERNTKPYFDKLLPIP